MKNLIALCITLITSTSLISMPTVNRAGQDIELTLTTAAGKSISYELIRAGGYAHIPLAKKYTQLKADIEWVTKNLLSENLDLIPDYEAHAVTVPLALAVYEKPTKMGDTTILVVYQKNNAFKALAVGTHLRKTISQEALRRFANI